ncbi:MAG: alpha/beta hydrolase [archaeon]|nr:alpha/beta hydrolase [archaeon]
MGSLINKILFMPPSRPHVESDSDIYVKTAHGNDILIKKIIKEPSYMYLLISHGNAEDVDAVYNWAEDSLSRYVNVNIIMYEYTGYGTNPEGFLPSEQFCYDDIDAAYTYLTEELQINPSRIIVFGRSVGSGPSCYLAEKHDVGGLILNSGFMSVYRIIFKFRFTLPGDKFPNIDRMKNINCPVCVFHSIKDEIIPFYHGKEMYKAAKFKFDPLFIDGTNHNNIDKLSDDVFKHMNKFFKFLDQNYKEIDTASVDEDTL